MFGFFSEYYYVALILQAICALHSIRRGTQNKWIWIIVFLPLVGSIAYIFSEIIKKQHISTVQDGVATIIRPTGKVKDLEKRFNFSNTFANRVALADAYLDSGMYQKARELYEGGLTGMFHDNEHVIKQLIQCYYHLGRYEDIIPIAPKVSGSMDFSKSVCNLMYAHALEKTGKVDLADEEFQRMNHRFSNYEARYSYGCFLLRNDRKEDAASLFNEILGEAEHLSSQEKRNCKVWIEKTRVERNKMMTKA